MKIKNSDQLRNHILRSIEKLDENKIDINELATIAKAGETIFSSLKLQLAYNNMRNEIPNIEFLQSCNDGKPIKIECSPVKSLNTKR